MGLGRPADPEHIGDTFLWMKRSEKGPNTFSQTIKNLQPGRLYSMKMFTCDYQDLIHPKTKTLEEANEVHRDASAGRSRSRRPAVIHGNVSFQPRAHDPRLDHLSLERLPSQRPDAKLTVSDWPAIKSRPAHSARSKRSISWKSSPITNEPAATTLAELAARALRGSAHGCAFSGRGKLATSARNSGSLRIGSRSGSISRLTTSAQPLFLPLRRQSSARSRVVPDQGAVPSRRARGQSVAAGGLEVEVFILRRTRHQRLRDPGRLGMLAAPRSATMRSTCGILTFGSSPAALRISRQRRYPAAAAALSPEASAQVAS